MPNSLGFSACPSPATAGPTPGGHRPGPHPAARRRPIRRRPEALGRDLDDARVALKPVHREIGIGHMTREEYLQAQRGRAIVRKSRTIGLDVSTYLMTYIDLDTFRGWLM